MNTNVQIIQKEFDTFNNGDTTRCIILGKLTLPKDLLELVTTLPGFKKFVNSQTGILWYEDNHIEVEGMAYAYRHEVDTPNPKLGEYIADTKAQRHMFKLAANFQDHLRWFIIRSLGKDLDDGAVGCAYAMNSCDNHIEKLIKQTSKIK